MGRRAASVLLSFSMQQVRCRSLGTIKSHDISTREMMTFLARGYQPKSVGLIVEAVQCLYTIGEKEIWICPFAWFRKMENLGCYF
ncbi:hypothetical protein DAI22_04g044200 [Oryza sativa Japonica Group]|nr:hypothetical protein DAI22_04g044200 [Oryza sativa Japonica Group]